MSATVEMFHDNKFHLSVPEDALSPSVMVLTVTGRFDTITIHLGQDTIEHLLRELRQGYRYRWGDLTWKQWVKKNSWDKA